MASKLGLLLSFIIFVQAMLFAGDVLVYQVAYTQLIAETIVVNRKLEQHQGMTEAVILYVAENLHAEIKCWTGCEGVRGDQLTYQIQKDHSPILAVLWGETMSKLIIERTVLLP